MESYLAGKVMYEQYGTDGSSTFHEDWKSVGRREIRSTGLSRRHSRGGPAGRVLLPPVPGAGSGCASHTERKFVRTFAAEVGWATLLNFEARGLEPD
jgi:hypothetical protein